MYIGINNIIYYLLYVKNMFFFNFQRSEMEYIILHLKKTINIFPIYIWHSSFFFEIYDRIKYFYFYFIN